MWQPGMSTNPRFGRGAHSGGLSPWLLDRSGHVQSVPAAGRSPRRRSPGAELWKSMNRKVGAMSTRTPSYRNEVYR